MSASGWIAAGSLGLGTAFFVAGTVGMLRFPDTFSRLHAMTKADSLGLGLTCLGLALLSGSWAAAAKLALVWGLVLVASAGTCSLIARRALRSGPAPGASEERGGLPP